MAAQDGVGLILQYNTTGSTFVAYPGQRNTSVALNHEIVDITSKDDESTANNTLYRKLLDGAGVQTCSITATGVFKDDANESTVRDLLQTRTAGTFKVVVPGSNLNNIQGSFQVASLTKSGDYNDSVTYDITLESAGDISFTT